ncbi:MAG: hypothetical protein QXU62_04465 [Thermofilaceae archaeon]
MLENNLLNITLKNPAFIHWARRVAQGVNIPPELQRWAEQLRIAAGDAFFLYYSLFPQLRDANPDLLLNAVLDIFKNHVKEPNFRVTRAKTVYNDFLSSLLARRFLVHLVEEIREQLEQLPPPPSPPSSASGPQQGAGEGGEGGGGGGGQQSGGGDQNQQQGGGGDSTGSTDPTAVGQGWGGLPLPPDVLREAVGAARAGAA